MDDIIRNFIENSAGVEYDTGSDLEDDWFPVTRDVKGKITDDGSWKPSYRPYKSAMRQVMSPLEGWDPTNPATRIANDFHASVCEEMGEEDYSQVRMYPCIGTSMDFYHGVDFVMRYRNNIVTFDMTLNPDKEEYKADIVFNPSNAVSMEFAITQAARMLNPQTTGYVPKGEAC